MPDKQPTIPIWATIVSGVLHPGLLQLSVFYVLCYPDWILDIFIISVAYVILPGVAYYLTIRHMSGSTGVTYSKLVVPSKWSKVVALFTNLLGTGVLLSIIELNLLPFPDDVEYCVVICGLLAFGLLIITLTYNISMHMAGLGCISVLLAYMFLPHSDSTFQALFASGLVVLNLLVGYARIKVEAHDIWQVLAGFAFGGGISAIFLFS